MGGERPFDPLRTKIMKLIFLYGQVASGKLTVAKALAAKTGLALFHNHLIVDAVAAVFPFGSDDFIRLREAFWLETIQTAAALDRSLIFTFAPEPTVTTDFVIRVREAVERHGGEVLFVALQVTLTEQEKRLTSADRRAFGKLRSLELLRELRHDFSSCMDAMPKPRLSIDTGALSPEAAADQIIQAMSK
jgi:hypothetical protein